MTTMIGRIDALFFKQMGLSARGGGRRRKRAGVVDERSFRRGVIMRIMQSAGRDLHL